MLGFIKGIFEFIKSVFSTIADIIKSGNGNDEVVNVPKQGKGAYFLNQDAASTMGDVEYMRSAKSVKRTYAKTVESPTEKATIKQVSSMTRKVYEEGESLAQPAYQAPSYVPQNTPTFAAPAASAAPAKPKAAESAERRKTDTSMDMFRNMAKEIRK